MTTGAPLSMWDDAPEEAPAGSVLEPTRRAPDVTWRCETCDHVERQPAAVSDVVHLCGKGERPRHLVRQ